MVLVVGGVLLFGSTSVTVQDVGMARLPVDGRELAVGGEVWGTLGEEDQVLVLTRVQAWGLELREGQQVTVDMTSDDFDAFLDINGQGLLLFDDDGGGGCQARITFTAPQDGLYRVVASPGLFSRMTGQFVLRVGSEPGPLAEGFCVGV